MLSPMNSSFQNSANPLIAKVKQLFSRDLGLGKRLPATGRQDSAQQIWRLRAFY